MNVGNVNNFNNVNNCRILQMLVYRDIWLQIKQTKHDWKTQIVELKTVKYDLSLVYMLLKKIKGTLKSYTGPTKG